MSRNIMQRIFVTTCALLLWSQASLAAQNPQIIVGVEEPGANFTATGISTIRGYALGPAGIDRVEFYVDGELRKAIPYGGPRGDVCNTYANYADCASSGFAMAYNFNLLDSGNHNFRVVATAPNGDYNEQSFTLRVRKFHRNYINSNSALNLGSASFQNQGNDLLIQNAYVDGQPYNLTFRWNIGSQAPELYDIAAGSGGNALQVAGQWEMFSEVDASNCGEGTETNNMTMSITQSGAQVTFATDNPISGTLNGNTLTMPENYSGEGETLNINWTFNFASGGNFVRGTGNWTWTGNGDSCTGTTLLVGSRN